MDRMRFFTHQMEQVQLHIEYQKIKTKQRFGKKTKKKKNVTECHEKELFLFGELKKQNLISIISKLHVFSENA